MLNSTPSSIINFTGNYTGQSLGNSDAIRILSASTLNVTGFGSTTGIATSYGIRSLTTAATINITGNLSPVNAPVIFSDVATVVNYR